jgi:RNA polymerase sigma factor (sigma-70 family)
VELPPFQSLLDAHGRDVHRFLVASVGAGDADDCYQETWLSALRAYPRVRDRSNLRGWLFTIAHRKAIDRLRARRRGPVPAGDALPEPPVTASAATGLHALLPDEPLWEAVRALPTKQRGAITLRFVLDADYAAIAGVLGCSEEAARRSVFEGLKRLRSEVPE